MTEIDGLSYEELVNLRAKIESKLPEVKEVEYNEEVHRQHTQIYKLTTQPITKDNIDEVRKIYPDVKVGEVWCDNKALSDLIDHDELTLFQYDYLVDECDPNSMSETARNKIFKIWDELRFLHKYYGRIK